LKKPEAGNGAAKEPPDRTALVQEQPLKTCLLISSILMLGACTPPPPPEPPAKGTGSVVLPSDPASCKLAGGAFKPVGKMQTLQCVINYADAGQICTSGSQCAGDCRATSGIDAVPGQKVAGFCQATSDRFGCSTRVENGRAESTICID
jgi:hypothetical protein